jgi:hypothetical protein
MKHLILFLINIISLAVLAHPVIAQGPKDGECAAEMMRNWGSDDEAGLFPVVKPRDVEETERTAGMARDWAEGYDAPSTEPVITPGVRGRGRAEIIRNWGGEYD